jgi:arylsulfatase A-like enzyme
MNVIWVISDTLRCDHLGAYGNKTIHTPSLDAFAAKSVRFDRHYIAGFPTMPTRADYLTGRWTMTYMLWEPLFDDEVTLPQRLSKKGIQTAAIVDTPFYVRNGMNYDRGFQTFEEITGQLSGVRTLGKGEDKVNIMSRKVPEFECCAPKTLMKSMQWLENHYNEPPFFLYIDMWDPHEPWDAPWYYTELYWPGYDGRQVRPLYGYWPNFPGYTEEKIQKAHAAYCGEVTMVDTWFGHFMRQVENMGLLKDTMVIFTSDHGYQFGEHGGFFGKMIMARDPKTGEEIPAIWGHSLGYEEVTSIPLFIYVPGVEPGVYSGLTSAVDLMPTVMEIMGQEIPSLVDGQSLLPKIHDRALPGRDYVVSAHPFMNAGESVSSVDGIPRLTERDSSATITTDEWTLLYTTEAGLSELYNVKTDPKQEKNIVKGHPDKANELHQLLVKFMKENNMPDKLINPRLHLEI